MTTTQSGSFSGKVAFVTGAASGIGRAAALAFARAVGEFGSVTLISGNKPFDTQVSSVYAFKQLESDNITGAAAVSVVLLAVSLVVLVGMRVFESRVSHRG